MKERSNEECPYNLPLLLYFILTMSEDYTRISTKFVQLTAKVTNLSKMLSFSGDSALSNNLTTDWVRNLATSHEAYVSELNRLIKNLQEEDYVRPHINDILHMYRSDNDFLKDLLNNYDKAIQRIERDAIRKLKQFEQESKFAYNELEERFFMQKDINNQLSLKLEKYKGYKQRSSKLVSGKENEITELKKEKSRLSQALKTAELNLEMLQKDIERIREIKNNEIENVKVQNRILEGEILNIQNKVRESKEATKEKFRKNIEEIKAKHEAHVEDIMKNHAQDLAAFCRRMEENVKEINNEHDERVNSLNEKIKAVEAEKTKLNQDLNNLLKTREGAWSGKYKLLQEIYEKRLQELNTEHDSILKQTVDKWTQDYNSMKEKLESSRELEINSLKQEYEKKLDDTKKHYEKTILDLNKKWEEILKQTSAEYTSKIAERDHNLNREIKLKEQIMLRLDDFINKSELDRKNLVKESDKLKLELEDEKQHRIQVEESVQSLTQEVKVKEEKVQEVTKQIEIQKDKIMREVKENYERKLLEIKIQNQYHVDILNSNKESQEDKYRDNIKSLEKKYENLLKLYNNRPSRSEDLKKIRKLHEELIYKENALRQSIEDTKLLRLELVNREETYNKYFRQPKHASGLQPSASQRLPRTSSPFSARLMIRSQTPTKLV